MLLIAASLAILVIYAGVKLLIQAKKEILGSSYRRAAWCFILAGFIILICTGAHCAAMCNRYGTHFMCWENEKLNEENH